MTLSAALETLGSEVWDALAKAGNTPFGPGGDGFDILAVADVPGEVVVLFRRDGILDHLPAAPIFRREMGCFERDLIHAGWAVRRVEATAADGPFPVLLCVTRSGDGSTK